MTGVVQTSTDRGSGDQAAQFPSGPEPLLHDDSCPGNRFEASDLDRECEKRSSATFFQNALIEKPETRFVLFRKGLLRKIESPVELVFVSGRFASMRRTNKACLQGVPKDHLA